MKGKSIIIVIIILAIVVFLGYWFLGRPSNGNNGATSMPSPTVQSEVSALLGDLQKEISVSGNIVDGQFQWITAITPKVTSVAIPGKGFSASRIDQATTVKIDSFFEAKGFARDINNEAGGVASNLEGWKKANVFCQVLTGPAGGLRNIPGQPSEPMEPGFFTLDTKCGQI